MIYEHKRKVNNMHHAFNPELKYSIFIGLLHTHVFVYLFIYYLLPFCLKETFVMFLKNRSPGGIILQNIVAICCYYVD